MISLQLRLPEDVKAWLALEAHRNERSQNAQIVWILRQAMAAQAAETSVPAGDESPNLPPAGRINPGRTG